MKQNQLYTCGLFLLLLFITSCAGESYRINIEDIPSSDKTDTTKYYTIAFEAQVSSVSKNEFVTRGIYTPDTIPFPVNRYVHMYIYKENITPITGTPFAFSILKSNTQGTMTPISSQYELKLPPGTYNAYAVSELNTTYNNQLTFVNSNGAGGEKVGFANSLDFLWWKQENIVVSELANEPIQVIFQQLCTHIQLNIHAGEGQKILNYYSGDISAPTVSACTLQLATGIVTPAPTVDSNQRINLTRVDSIYYVDLVPFTLEGNILVKLNVEVEQGYSGWKDIYLPAPEDSQFKQGNAYIYNVYYDLPSKTFMLFE